MERGRRRRTCHRSDPRLIGDVGQVRARQPDRDRTQHRRAVGVVRYRHGALTTCAALDRCDLHRARRLPPGAFLDRAGGHPSSRGPQPGRDDQDRSDRCHDVRPRNSQRSHWLRARQPGADHRRSPKTQTTRSIAASPVYPADLVVLQGSTAGSRSLIRLVSVLICFGPT